MGYFTDKDNHIIVKRHKMIMVFSILKIVFLWCACIFLFYIGELMKKSPNPMIFLRVSDFLILFCIMHYAFFSLIWLFIKYFNNVIIISKDTITIIKCSLILNDDIEVIDCYRIVKVDAFIDWLMPNIFRYGEVAIEQQKNDIKVLHYIPRPYELLGIIKRQREQLLSTGNNLH